MDGLGFVVFDWLADNLVYKLIVCHNRRTVLHNMVRLFKASCSVCAFRVMVWNSI